MNSHESRRTHNLIINVILLIGGAKSIAAKAFAGITENIVFAADNDFENAIRKSLHQDLGVTQISIGGGQTTATVLADAAPNVKAASEHMTLAPLHHGMCANAVLGELAALLYSRCPEFQELLRSIIERVLQASKGSPVLIRLQVLHSIAGGQGSGMWIILAVLIARALAKLGVPVTVEFDTLCAIAFTGLSENCRLNVGATLPALIEYVAKDKSHPLITKRLELGELPPLGQNQTLRELLVLLETQAINSQAFREKRDILLPNLTKGEFGGVLIRETDFTAHFSPDETVLPAVCAAYYQAIKYTLQSETVDESRFERDVWTPFGEAIRRTNIDALVSRHRSLDFPSFLASVKQPALRIVYRLAFDLPDGGRFEVHDVDQLMSDSPATFEEAADRLATLVTSEAVTKDIEKDCEASLREIAAEITAGERNLQALFRKAKTGSVFRAAPYWLSRLARASHALRALSDEQCEVAAKLVESRAVLERVEKQRRKLVTQLKQVEVILASHLPRGDQARVTNYFQFVDSGVAFPALFQLPDKEGTRQNDILCGLASRLTLEGLAALLGTRFADVREIARAIVHGEPAYRSPPLGGFRRQSETKTLIVLPPIEERFVASIEDAIRELSTQGQAVVVNETMKCGCGVLRINYRVVRRLEEVFCGLIEYSTREAHGRPDRDATCLTGGEALNRLGIQLNGEGLVFPTPHC